MLRVIDCPTHCQKGTNWVANLCIFNCIILHFSIAKYSSRYGQPIDQSFVRLALNKFSYRNQIKDESGNIFHFTLHQFRHTYAMKLLNGGADIYLVQDLMGHLSLSMTMKYAKLLDQTKREVFNSIVQQGVFRV